MTPSWAWKYMFTLNCFHKKGYLSWNNDSSAFKKDFFKKMAPNSSIMCSGETGLSCGWWSSTPAGVWWVEGEKVMVPHLKRTNRKARGGVNSRSTKEWGEACIVAVTCAPSVSALPPWTHQPQKWHLGNNMQSVSTQTGQMSNSWKICFDFYGYII